LLNLRNSDYSKNYIIVGEINIIRNSAEKRGGIFGRDPFCDNIKELIMEWGLLGIPLHRGKFNWTNMRAGPRHIVARLDRFLVHNNFLLHNATIKYCILPLPIFDNDPISLHLQSLPNYGLLPF
jgi:hypothetical protein